MIDLAKLGRRKAGWEAFLERFTARREVIEAKIAARIRHYAEKIELGHADLDPEKVALAETIIVVSDYHKGGAEWYSCVRDAIKQFSTGERVGPYKDLWKEFFGTKDYARWIGQRCDCAYGYGPRHGSIVFRIAVRDEVRKTRKQSDLTPEEVEAVLHYLYNLKEIQDITTAVATRLSA